MCFVINLTEINNETHYVAKKRDKNELVQLYNKADDAYIS
jgi:hypothetical protein